MKISNVEFENNVFLAPMAGITNLAFRQICRSMGAGFVYTEMVSSKGLYYGSENTEELLAYSENEGSIGVQVFGNEPKIMCHACEFFNTKNHISVIDINMGCPAPKIVKNGEGSALMKYPKLAAEIVSEMKKVSIKPITVKIRKGFDEAHINAVDFAKLMEQAGADAIAIHGRTRAQMYEGKADWNIVKQVKEAVNIPVIGNGDIFEPQDASDMLSETNCDGVMVGRGSLGNPWIFKQIIQKFNNEEITYPSDEEKISMCIKHLDLEIAQFGEDRAVRQMRKNVNWYVKGMVNCTELKNRINYEKKAEDVKKILNEFPCISKC